MRKMCAKLRKIWKNCEKSYRFGEFCVLFATEKKFVKKMTILGFFQRGIPAFD